MDILGGGHSSTCGWVLLLLTCFHMNIIILYCSSAVFCQKFWRQFWEHYCRTAFGVVVVVVMVKMVVIAEMMEFVVVSGGWW